MNPFLRRVIALLLIPALLAPMAAECSPLAEFSARPVLSTPVQFQETAIVPALVLSTVAIRPQLAAQVWHFISHPALSPHSIIVGAMILGAGVVGMMARIKVDEDPMKPLELDPDAASAFRRLALLSRRNGTVTPGSLRNAFTDLRPEEARRRMDLLDNKGLIFRDTAPLHGITQTVHLSFTGMDWRRQLHLQLVDPKRPDVVARLRQAYGVDAWDLAKECLRATSQNNHLKPLSPGIDQKKLARILAGELPMDFLLYDRLYALAYSPEIGKLLQERAAAPAPAAAGGKPSWWAPWLIGPATIFLPYVMAFLMDQKEMRRGDAVTAEKLRDMSRLSHQYATRALNALFQLTILERRGKKGSNYIDYSISARVRGLPPDSSEGERLMKAIQHLRVSRLKMNNPDLLATIPKVRKILGDSKIDKVLGVLILLAGAGVYLANPSPSPHSLMLFALTLAGGFVAMMAGASREPVRDQLLAQLRDSSLPYSHRRDILWILNARELDLLLATPDSMAPVGHPSWDALITSARIRLRALRSTPPWNPFPKKFPYLTPERAQTILQALKTARDTKLREWLMAALQSKSDARLDNTWRTFLREREHWITLRDIRAKKIGTQKIMSEDRLVKLISNLDKTLGAALIIFPFKIPLDPVWNPIIYSLLGIGGLFGLIGFSVWVGNKLIRKSGKEFEPPPPPANAASPVSDSEHPGDLVFFGGGRTEWPADSPTHWRDRQRRIGPLVAVGQHAIINWMEQDGSFQYVGIQPVNSLESAATVTSDPIGMVLIHRQGELALDTDSVYEKVIGILSHRMGEIVEQQLADQKLIRFGQQVMAAARVRDALAAVLERADRVGNKRQLRSYVALRWEISAKVGVRFEVIDEAVFYRAGPTAFSQGMFPASLGSSFTTSMNPISWNGRRIGTVSTLEVSPIWLYRIWRGIIRLIYKPRAAPLVLLALAACFVAHTLPASPMRRNLDVAA